jgi:hypothetical protein
MYALGIYEIRSVAEFFLLDRCYPAMKGVSYSDVRRTMPSAALESM